ncbi:MAG: S8 family serine peptidase [Chitinophagaceae bacterium]|nr:S8 family serine peptidase [Chitinophagaceae bacterium]
MRYIFSLVIAFIFLSMPGQSQPATQYLIKLKNKTGTPFSIDRPQEFLSQRAIERRQKQGIAIVENDLPVNPAYLDSIASVENVTVKNVSKWLNQVCIVTSDVTALDRIAQFTFVQGAQRVLRQGLFPSVMRPKLDLDLKDAREVTGVRGMTSLDYGLSEKQVTIHKGDFLHDKGFTGRGVLISIIDAGYTNYMTLPAFDSIRLNGRILDTYDFVANKVSVNDAHNHGMQCLSIMAANVPGQMIGTAPGASYLLYRSEDGGYESPAEEQYWIAAAERSDSAGADVVTTSLGYTTFNNPAFDYTYNDMNGTTTIISRGAAIAASKGMIMLVAAGNDGNKSWHYIGTPADAFGVLTVGAVDVNGDPGAFSSYGPSSDGRQKPEVSSVGVATYVQGPSGNFQSGNGTSFATPNLAGLVACLWQAFPEFTSQEIMDVVIRSSNRYSNPDFKMGYGIPDFETAYNSLDRERTRRMAEKVLDGNNLVIFPNPVNSLARIVLKPQSTGEFSIALYDMSGRLFFRQKQTLTAGEVRIIPFSKNTLVAGIYILKIQNGSEQYSRKIVIE